jgi:hypothetical protein
VPAPPQSQASQASEKSLRARAGGCLALRSGGRLFSAFGEERFAIGSATTPYRTHHPENQPCLDVAQGLAKWHGASRRVQQPNSRVEFLVPWATVQSDHLCGALRGGKGNCRRSGRLWRYR